MSFESPSGVTAPLDLLFTGPLFCDLIFSGVRLPEPGTEVYADAFRLTPGGTANLAVASSRLGAVTVLLSEVGDDALGSQVSAMLSGESNLNLSWLQRVSGFQTPVTVSLTGRHERSFITYLESRPLLEWPKDAPSVGATHVPVVHELPSWIPRVRSEGTTVFAGVGWDPTGEWSSSVLHRLKDVDVFVLNDTEAMAYTRTDNTQDAARELGRYVELVVVTSGSRGVVSYESATGRFIEVPTVVVKPVDPTGAGDIFVAALMATDRFDWCLEDRLRFAALSASLSVRSLGGAVSAPLPSDIEEFLALVRPKGDWTRILSWARAHERIR